MTRSEQRWFLVDARRAIKANSTLGPNMTQARRAHRRGLAILEREYRHAVADMRIGPSPRRPVISTGITRRPGPTWKRFTKQLAKGGR